MDQSTLVLPLPRNARALERSSSLMIEIRDHHYKQQTRPITQLVEFLSYKQAVIGSSPVGPIM